MADMDAFRTMINSGHHIRVYKYEAGSSLTTGILSWVSKLNGGDVDFFVLKADWDSPEHPFAVDGDSGSLVFAKQEATVIPLDMQCESNTADDKSI
ncbi:hypothetical protein AJ79_09742 [Helicocarpus griseus UAMH5409]|uniref:Uncharacterized protein n=1 Tax=Helicocarpus griseus UAMH5409 TaxID=1447875 RepID=A0A2B7WHJ7_9EURO|nr:hypothetical protein AJ79_09742 [Helicocarpus griseus UAMH5409]